MSGRKYFITLINPWKLGKIEEVSLYFSKTIRLKLIRKPNPELNTGRFTTDNDV